MDAFSPFEIFGMLMVSCFCGMVRARGWLPFPDMRLQLTGRAEIAKWGSIQIFSKLQIPGKRHWRISRPAVLEEGHHIFHVAELKGFSILRLIGVVVLPLAEVE